MVTYANCNYSDASGQNTAPVLGQTIIATGAADAFWQPVAAQPVSMIIPAYQYPTVGTFWAQMEAAGGPPVGSIVADVTGSGPGTAPADSVYVAAIAAARATGIRVFGYIDTVNATVSTATVAAMVTGPNSWSTLYGVTDIFLDECPTAAGAGVTYINTVTTNIRTVNPGAKIILNFGTVPDQGYAQYGDILVVYEDASANWGAFAAPTWFQGYPPSKFAAIIHTASGRTLMAQRMSQIQAAGIGNAFVTEDINYATLPAYWNAEVAMAEASFGAYMPATGVSAVVPLTYVASGTTLVDAAKGNVFTLTLTASNTTLGNPSNPTDGQEIRFRVKQDATGSRTFSAYGSAYSFGTAGAPTLTITASRTDVLKFQYDGVLAKWEFLGANLGFS